MKGITYCAPFFFFPYYQKRLNGCKYPLPSTPTPQPQLERVINHCHHFPPYSNCPPLEPHHHNDLYHLYFHWPLPFDVASICIIHKCFEGLLAFCTKAIKGKGTWYWAHLEPILIPHPEPSTMSSLLLFSLLFSCMSGNKSHVGFTILGLHLLCV